jgi:hypothetical protein
VNREEPQPGTPRARREAPDADAPPDGYRTYIVPVDLHADVPVFATSAEGAGEFVRERANHEFLLREHVWEVVVGDPVEVGRRDSLEAQNAQLTAALRRYEAGEIGSTVARETLGRLGLAGGAS